MRRTREADQGSKLFKKTEKCKKDYREKIHALQGLEQGCFVSRQVRSLEIGRDKKETYLISLKPADGAFSWAETGRREDRPPERGVLRADRR